MKYKNIRREEELKNKVADDYFENYDSSRIIGNIDFCISIKQDAKQLFEQDSILWAEAKKDASDIYNSISQLILTIGKAKTFDKHLPPSFLGAFDAQKIAFVPYSDIHDVFYQNDFNWNVTPSNYDTKEFKLIREKVQKTIDNNALLFVFEKDDKELNKFVKENFVSGKTNITKTRIDKNNFIIIYNKWLQSVKSSIAVNWDIAKKKGIIDGDFYLADLLSMENESIKEKLSVLLQKDHYVSDRLMDDAGMFISKRTDFNDKQTAHTQFWNRYERPPKEEYWDYIVRRRDLLVPQDIRERKGSFFTPQIWVELSQKYLKEVLGEDWQDEYYIWDCAAGTGNLLAGLTNKYNIWASTLDKQDVEVMHDRIDNGANLLKDHVFQFDFLNDEFTKLPKPLQDIVNNPEKRKKLVVYINPPYAEATTARTITGTGENKAGTAIENKTYTKYKDIGKASNELFTQFLIRIYKEIPNCKIANFSKLKNLQSSNFSDFRNVFLARLEKIFIMPADTFDNVKGQFPIGFFVWNTDIKEKFQEINADVFNEKGILIGTKSFYGNLPESLNKWMVSYQSKKATAIGTLFYRGNDFQNQKYIYIAVGSSEAHDSELYINQTNLILISIYLSVRHCIEATWLNDRDQFLFPNDGWEKDKEFQNDCLAFALFHGQNRITSKEGTNHWIPFTEAEVNSREKFESNFMSKYIQGKLKPKDDAPNLLSILMEPAAHYETPLIFSTEAKAVFMAGRELWKYYHQQPNCNVNASLYDIREHFQGRKEKGRMNSSSPDEEYSTFMKKLRESLKLLAKKIEPKVYEYGFLKE